MMCLINTNETFIENVVGCSSKLNITFVIRYYVLIIMVNVLRIARNHTIDYILNRILV